MFVVCVEFTIKPDLVDAFMPLMKAQAINSLELEDDCHRFDICIDETDPAIVFLYEIYKDRAAFDEHLASDHFKSFDKVVASMVASKSVKTLKLVT